MFVVTLDRCLTISFFKVRLSDIRYGVFVTALFFMWQTISSIISLLSSRSKLIKDIYALI